MSTLDLSNTADSVLANPRVQEIIARGAREGALSYHSINSLLGDLQLDEHEVEALLETLERRGVNVVDVSSPPESQPVEATVNGNVSRSTPVPGTPPSTSPVVEAAPEEEAATDTTNNESITASAPDGGAHSDLDDVLAALRGLEASLAISPPPRAARREMENEDETDNADADMEDAFRQYMNRMGQVPLLSEEEERRLARLSREGTPREREQARQKLTEANLRLVVSIARSYAARSSLSFLDIMQEGNIGLMRAIERFDPDRHKRLSSYATWWIRRSIGKALAEHSRSMRLPGHLYQVVQKINRVRQELMQDLNRPPSRHELAQAAEMSVEMVDEALRVVSRPLSLEAPVGEEEETELGETLSDDVDAPAEAQDRSELRQQLAGVLEDLPGRERAIVLMRFGMGDYAAEGPQTHEDIAAKMNLSRERVRQLEIRALRKLRRRAKGTELGMFFDEE